ncbi:MAG: hypothetical protein NC117_04350 [Pseudoflavonifractor sp.]|nr:hypothetical protein [Pseudoflavonifractor sp.]
MTTKESYKSLFASAKRMAMLKFEGFRLGAVDKATVLLSTIALILIAFMLVSAFLLFLAMALTHLLSTVIAIEWAYLVMGTFFLVILLAIYLARRRLIFDPVAKALSRLFLSPENHDDHESR